MTPDSDTFSRDEAQVDAGLRQSLAQLPRPQAPVSLAALVNVSLRRERRQRVAMRAVVGVAAAAVVLVAAWIATGKLAENVRPGAHVANIPPAPQRPEGATVSLAEQWSTLSAEARMPSPPTVSGFGVLDAQHSALLSAVDEQWLHRPARPGGDAHTP